MKDGVIRNLPDDKKEILRSYFLKEIRIRINSQGKDLAKQTKAEAKS